MTPRWVYEIWKLKNKETVLRILPADSVKLKKLIEETQQEKYIAYAWFLYVTEEDPIYSVTDKEEEREFFNPKTGKFQSFEKTIKGSATKFPLASFLSMPDGYYQAALDVFEQSEQKVKDHFARLDRAKPEWTIGPMFRPGGWFDKYGAAGFGYKNDRLKNL
jgi:hypothetical protein